MPRPAGKYTYGNTRLKTVLTCFLCWLLILSCKKNPYPDQSLGNELVILAEISAGDSLNIPISKSIQVGSGGIISFEKVNSASVKIFRPDGKSYTLRLNASPDYATDPASIYTSPSRPRSNTTYNLQVQDPLSGTVTAVTTLPSPVRVTHMDTSSDRRSGIDILHCRLTLADTSDAEHYYVFEAVKQLVVLDHYFLWKGKRYDYDQPAGKKSYATLKDSPGVRLLLDTIPRNVFKRLNIFTDDINVDNAQVSSLDSPFRRIFLPGHYFAGSSYTTSVFIDRKYFKANQNTDLGWVVIQVKSVSPELYNYLFWYEKYRTDVGSVPTSQLYSPPGNVQNGLGIFGGSSRRQWIFCFDDLHQ